MIFTINFSTHEANPCWEYKETLNIEAAEEEVNEVYRNVLIDEKTQVELSGVLDPLSRSLIKYEAFLKALDERKIKYSKVNLKCFIF